MMGGNSNVFAALDSLRKKKKSSDKESKSSKGSSSKKEQEPEVLWAPAPLTVKSWADVDDEDDDDYYATTAPLQSFLGSNESEKKPEPVEVIALLCLLFYACYVLWVRMDMSVMDFIFISLVIVCYLFRSSMIHDYIWEVDETNKDSVVSSIIN